MKQGALEELWPRDTFSLAETVFLKLPLDGGAVLDAFQWTRLGTVRKTPLTHTTKEFGAVWEINTKYSTFLISMESEPK